MSVFSFSSAVLRSDFIQAALAVPGLPPRYDELPRLYRAVEYVESSAAAAAKRESEAAYSAILYSLLPSRTRSFLAMSVFCACA